MARISDGKVAPITGGLLSGWLKYKVISLRMYNTGEGVLARQGEKLSVGAGHYLISRPDKIRGTTATGHGSRINLHKISACYG